MDQFLQNVWCGSLFLVIMTSDVGGNQRRDTDGMVIYVGEGAGMNGIYNTPYFDQEMVSNYTVQASGNDLIKSKTIMHCF